MQYKSIIVITIYGFENNMGAAIDIDDLHTPTPIWCQYETPLIRFRFKKNPAFMAPIELSRADSHQNWFLTDCIRFYWIYRSLFGSAPFFIAIEKHRIERLLKQWFYTYNCAPIWLIWSFTTISNNRQFQQIDVISFHSAGRLYIRRQIRWSTQVDPTPM